MPLLPYVRRELFLQAIKNRDASALPDPNNREELFLKAIAEETALIPTGVSVVLPAAVSEMLANLPEAHTHTELFYKEILDTILTTSTVTDTTPFISRETAGGLPVSGTAELKKKLGNTVCVNQLVDKAGFPATKTASEITFTNNGDGSVTANGTATATVVFEFVNYSATALIIGHKYYIQSGFTTTGSGSTFELMLTQVWAGTPNTNVNLYGFSQIFECGNNTNLHTLQFAVRNGATVNNLKCTPILIDLTLWFGSNDRIPSDLLAHPEYWGRYYAGSLAYAAGYLDSADGTVLKSIGRNVWDEEWESGLINQTTGQNAPNADYIRSKNYIPIIPGQQYYKYVSGFSGTNRILYYDENKTYMLGSVQVLNTGTMNPPAGAAFARFYAQGNTYASGITISLYYSGESGYDQYYPYSVLASVDTGSEVLRSAGAVADEKIPDGTITRKVGVVDLGTLDWNKYDTAQGPLFRCYAISGANIPSDSVDYCQCALYANARYADRVNKSLSLAYANQIDIIDSSYADAATFKTAMSGVMMNYQLATPTTEQGTAFDPVYDVEYGGTESWTNLKGIPQGHETEYTEYTT